MWRRVIVSIMALLAAHHAALAQNAFPLIGVGGQPSSLVEGGAARGLYTPEPFQVQSLKIQGINGVAQLLQVDKNGNVSGTGNLGGGGGGGSGLVVGMTTITGGSNGASVFDNNGLLGERGVTGTGVDVLNQSPTINNLTLIGPLTGNNVINSANLANGAALANIGVGSITNAYLAAGAALGNIGLGNITSGYLAPGAAQANISAGSITNAQLGNSSVTIGGSNLALGGATGNTSGNAVAGTLYVTGLNISGTCTGCAGVATSLAPGITLISPAINGDLEYDNNGVLAERSPTFTFGGSAVTLGGSVADGSGDAIAGTAWFTNLALNGSGFSIGGAAIVFPGSSATLATLTLPETFAAAQSFGEVHGTAYQPTLSSNNYNAAITDCGQTLKLPTGTTPTVTLPNISPSTNECTIKMVQATSVAYTINAASGGSVVSGSGCTGITTLRQYAQIIATLFTPSASAAVWDVSGDCQ